MGRFVDRMADGVVRFRWPVIVVFVALTAFFASRIPTAQVDPEVKNQLPKHMRARIHIDQIEKIFGGSDMIMLVVEADDVLAPQTLKRLRKLGKGMERLPGIDRVLSPFTLKDIRAEGDQLLVEAAVKRIPRTEKAREKLRRALRENELVYGNVISKDFKAAALIGFMKAGASDEKTVEGLRRLIGQVPGPEPVWLAGMPFIRVHLNHDIRHDMKRFLPAGLLIMLVFLFLCFRQLRGVVLPFLVVVMSIAFSMGLIPLLGWKIQMITVLLPVILIAVANDYGIHLLARYQEDNCPGCEESSGRLAARGVRELAMPVLLTGLTTIAGLLSLQTHIVVPAKQLGILASAGVAFALVASLTFIPAVLAILRRPKPIPGLADETSERLIEKSLRRASEAVTRRPWLTLLVSLVVAAGTGTGIALLVVDTNPIHYYPPEAEVARASGLVDKHFGGSGVVSVVAEGDVKSPELLRAIDRFEKKLGTLPEVGQTSSIARVVRKMNRVLNADEPDNDRIPDSRDAVAQYFLLYSMSGDPEDFERMVDFDYRHAQITARINTLSSTAIDKVMRFIHRELEKEPEGRFPLVGGFVDLLNDLVKAIVSGQIRSLVLSLGLVAVMVMLLFRSFAAGLIAAIPLCLSMLMLFGIMGYAGIELNIATAMLSSIMIGVGVDYTIHFLWRYQAERREGLEPLGAVRKTLLTSGRGIVFNALSVMVGFVVVLLSAFLPVRFFGVLVVVSVGTCLVGALVVVPALCLIVRPRFLEPAAEKK
ncbi:MAG: RND family transporter [Deltaproteobacteria bacterium]|nr:MAG: RND family transporter [Deltaproteobacteria bacterium]